MKAKQKQTYILRSNGPNKKHPVTFYKLHCGGGGSA